MQESVPHQKDDLLKPLPKDTQRKLVEVYFRISSKDLALNRQQLEPYGLHDLWHLGGDVLLCVFDSEKAQELYMMYQQSEVLVDGLKHNALFLDLQQLEQKHLNQEDQDYKSFQDFSPQKDCIQMPMHSHSSPTDIPNILKLSDDRTTNCTQGDNIDSYASSERFKSQVVSPNTDFEWEERSPNFTSPQPTTVNRQDLFNTDNINTRERGGPQLLDPRTTLMVRNIPNRLSQNILLNYIDEKFLGCQDFFYMPIDKNSQANMGQAFINMTASKFVLEFHTAFNRYKWPHACSSKICEVSFARIQGQQCLCETFQKPNKSLSDKLPKPNIQAKYKENIFFKELPITPESQWRFQKKISNPSRAEDLPIAKQLQESHQLQSFDQIWPEIQNMIREKMGVNSRQGAYSQDDINTEQFKDLCKKVQLNTEQDMLTANGSGGGGCGSVSGVGMGMGLGLGLGLGIGINSAEPQNMQQLIHQEQNHDNLQILPCIGKPPGYN